MKVNIVHDTTEDAPNRIYAYMHCTLCLGEMPHDHSPREWARLEVGITEDGIQVYCTRHDVNVNHLKIEPEL